MGAGNSKPEGTSRHVFSSDTPVQFSQELVDSLQSSSETDSTRHKSFDIHIAERVQEELEKLHSREQSALEALTAKLASESSEKNESRKPGFQQEAPQPRLLDVASSTVHSIKESLSSLSSEEEEARKSLSSPKVLSAIEKLQKDLDSRKKVQELPEEVEKAREELVSCLRKNDRRPLDCWQEVEGFKTAVAILEKRFVDRVL